LSQQDAPQLSCKEGQQIFKRKLPCRFKHPSADAFCVPAANRGSASSTAQVNFFMMPFLRGSVYSGDAHAERVCRLNNQPLPIVAEPATRNANSGNTLVS
jgi:hypothetical protein